MMNRARAEAIGKVRVWSDHMFNVDRCNVAGVQVVVKNREYLVSFKPTFCDLDNINWTFAIVQANGGTQTWKDIRAMVKGELK